MATFVMTVFIGAAIIKCLFWIVMIAHFIFGVGDGY